MMNSDEGKDTFVEKVIPQLNQELKERRFNVQVVCFVSEIWKRQTDEKGYDMVEDYKEIPVTGEGVIIIIEDKNNCSTSFYNTVREDMKVDNEKGFSSKATLVFESENNVPTGTSVGRFANLYEKFTADYDELG